MKTDYRIWNNALWNYFFPYGNEDAILYVDNNVLETIATNAEFKYTESAANDFLEKTLVNDESSLREFRESYTLWTAERNFPGVDRWDKLVLFLKNSTRQIDKKPPYFAMLCAIMYLASSEGADHKRMTTLAKQYLGEGYRGKKPGDMVDVLMKKLHEDQKSFNPDRMDCGEQRQMSRIKYHLVLKSKERQDFVDFLEVGNLQWNDGSYADYANNILMPALQRANKPQKYFNIIKKNIPYVKNILLSDLNWGKDPSTSELGNTRQIKDVKWRYEMELDYDGNPCFYISTDYDLAFGVRLNNNGFEKTDEISDYIAFDVQFNELETAIVEHNGFEYCLSNLSQNDKGNWSKEIFFQQVGDRYYHQVVAPLEGKHYVKFIKTGTRGIERLTDGWKQSQIGVKGYETYMIDSFTASTTKTRQNNKKFVDDIFELCGVGTWFSIRIEEGQHLYWYPDMVSAMDEDETKYKMKMEDMVSAPNGMTYFKLPRNGIGYIRGNLIVKDDEGKELLSEQIKDNYAWAGQQTKYGYNEWGETIEGGSIPQTNAKPNAHHLIPNSADNVPLSKDSNMLIQILYDIADENGCVSRKELTGALNFVLEFYNIVPTKKNELNLIYALRRLGYIVAYYNGRDYVNQLVVPYLERTNYSFVLGVQNNAYLVKGVYSKESLQRITNDCDQIKYKRPYTNELLQQYPEYVCLPDFVFFTKRNDKIIDGWDVVEHPVAYDYLFAIADMNYFESHFIVGNGDVFMTQHKLDVPCMLNEKGKDVLCVMDLRGHYALRQSYSGTDGVYRNIPKQLSRVYCQNKHEKPIVILKTYRANKETVIESNSVTILHQMGKPELLDIALSDLNLGLPENNRCFVVDNSTSGLPCNEKDLYSYGDTYNTANSVEQVRQGLEKIGARKINDYFDSSSVFLSPRDMGYSMKMTVPSEGMICMALFDRDKKLVAFSIGSKKVYVSDYRGGYKEILGNSTVNTKMSAVINNGGIEYGGSYEGAVPNFDKAKEVKIIKKQQ